MKKLLAMLLLLTSTVYAQEVIDLQKPVKCSKPEVVMNYFRDNYQEAPIWVGKTNTNTRVTLIVNKETRTWTLIEYEANLACVLGAGETSSNPEI